MDSAFQLSARRSWPRAKLTGDGEYALVSTCCQGGIVRLYSTMLEASVDKHEHCEAAFGCAGNHVIYRLKPANTAYVFRQPGEGIK